MNEVLDSEKKVGIETFYTPYKGIGGHLRTYPEDFNVVENPVFPPKKEKGRFTISKVTAVNWETNHLIREISNRLHISRQRIGFAGTKDKRAKTTQLMSFYKVYKDKIKDLKIKDVKFEDIYYSDIPVKIGDLKGNSFLITIRDLNSNIDLEDIKNISSFLVKKGGFPNFYGIQRFGVIRSNTHIVGKYIVKGDFEKAVMNYVAAPDQKEDDDIYNMRKNLQDSYDFAYALKCFPDKLNFEKAMLNRLVVQPHDFIGALKQLPKNLLTMFVYAYQSFIFNRILSERIKNDLPLNEAVEGDFILPLRDRSNDMGILVTKKNIGKVNKQIDKGNAVVSGLLIGYDSRFSKGDMGDIEQKIVDEENINSKNFIVPEIPFLSSSGSRRSLLARVDDLGFNYNKDENFLNLGFTLDKGCYATSLLREFMKAEDIKRY